MNATALASSLVTRLRENWRLFAIVGASVVAGFLVIYALVTMVRPADQNRPVGKEIVAAVEAFKAANKRYPEHLADLQPKYLEKIPQPALGTNFVYAISPDGTSAWFGYQAPDGSFSEYGTDTRKWRDCDYDDSDALRMSTKEFVMGPK